jgi:hypothetical protein
MGWNDRLLEDPYIPYANQDDRDAYDNWQMYLAECQQMQLSSQNVDPAALPAPEKELPQQRDRPAVEFFTQLLKTQNANENKDQSQESETQEDSARPQT